MATQACDHSGCQVVESGSCLLSHPDPSACPHFRDLTVNAIADEPIAVPSGQTEPSPLPGSAARRFSAGLELGVEDTAEIMRARYSHLVGILGSSNAGKTCFLLSLYLMASSGGLPKTHLFAGSRTLPGFEARARLLRAWKGGPLPEKLADHTTLADARQPGFLHLALRETGGTKRLMNVLLTDLPGEWSTNLVNQAATADRFTFLRRADGIVIVVDGPVLSSATRHSELQRSRHLLDRLVESVGVDVTTPLLLLVSKYDQLQMQRPAAVDELEHHAKSLGFSPEVVLCAAFSTIPETIKNGLGVFETVEKILAYTPTAGHDDTSADETIVHQRAFLNFRHRVI